MKQQERLILIMLLKLCIQTSEAINSVLFLLSHMLHMSVMFVVGERKIGFPLSK